MIYKIGICDDEISACSEIEEAIIKYFKNKKDSVDVYTWSSAESFIRDVPEKIDIGILFLDIELPGKNGVDVGHYIRQVINNEGMHIIFISSNKSYAMELFDVHPYNFLIKPFTEEKICSEIAQLLKLNAQDNRFFAYEYNKNQYRILFRDILFFMSDKHNIIIVCADREEKYVGKLKDIIIGLPDNFAIINQSNIINIRHIKECHTDEVIMDNDVRLGISRSYKKNFNLKMIESNEGI